MSTLFQSCRRCLWVLSSYGREDGRGEAFPLSPLLFLVIALSQEHHLPLSENSPLSKYYHTGGGGSGTQHKNFKETHFSVHSQWLAKHSEAVKKLGTRTMTKARLRFEGQ